MDTKKELAAKWVDIDSIKPWGRNPKRLDESDVSRMVRSIERFGWADVIVAREADGEIISGHLRHAAAKSLGMSKVPVRYLPIDSAEAHALAVAVTQHEAVRTFDESIGALLADMQSEGIDLDGLGWSEDEISALIQEPSMSEAGSDAPVAGSMAATFGAPPVTLLDSRQGYWQERKRNWIAQGIKSEIGRADDLIGATREGFGLDYDAGKGEGLWGGSGTSVFDPVLAELLVRWFSPEGGTVLDPFAGGSVRGVVSAMVGRNYTGVDLRPKQVEANREQWTAIQERQPSPCAVEEKISDPDALTPIQKVGEVWLKRDDLFEINGANGGKARTIMRIAQGATGIITSGARQSTMLPRAARIAQYLGIGCRLHTAQGKDTPTTDDAAMAGAEVIRHKAGYLSVVKKRARDDAASLQEWKEIPWAGECKENIEQAVSQMPEALPDGVKRIVVCCGSGMTLAGILWGLKKRGIERPVLGVMVGSDPIARLNEWAPKDWSKVVSLVSSPIAYETEVDAKVGEIGLDPVYEAKCAEYLMPGDLLWIVGKRASSERGAATGSATWIAGDSLAVLSEGENLEANYDMVLSCPPYGDLEVYSDDVKDLSTMSGKAFLESYRSIIRMTVQRMAEDSFAAWVIGEYRDKSGSYVNFVGNTVSAFIDAGATLYNEAILVTPMGTLPLRAGNAFRASRKLGKTHQNVLVFLKGDARRAADKCGIVDFRLDAGALEDADVEA